MKSRDETIEKFRRYVAGCLAVGTNRFRKTLARTMTGDLDTPEALGKVMGDLESTAAEIIGKIYDDLKPPEPAGNRTPPPAASASPLNNGKAPAPPAPQKASEPAKR